MNVCILDYGSGNVSSVFYALKTLTDNVVISNDDKEIERATHLILPGVGSFKSAMDKMKQTNLIEKCHTSVFVRKKPFLGICVGMQILASKGYEHGECAGLAWIPGTVQKLETPGLRIPHVGWNNPLIKTPHPILKSIHNDIDFYFTHSYYFKPQEENAILATCDYGDLFPCMVYKDNIFGVQFHPEKSQKAGKILLKNFLDLS